MSELEGSLVWMGPTLLCRWGTEAPGEKGTCLGSYSVSATDLAP